MKCLHNLERVLKRCEKTNLGLNWEKCHFYGIKFPKKKKGLEVEKAKIKVIKNLTTNVQGVRNFLGHVSFYRRFRKDFVQVSKLLSQLLQKDVPFLFQ
ncbi:Retrotransposon gag protein [Gossypium australe]|uniref:Retrotransposon gag protein n=1 Tax=Gossypium australe TaxID=47621 RepID=A0A5B6UYL7_9ROSI|nr:Retrotransposon gag protein [Gossypium australe]